jgi:hypothetical protein
MLKREMVSFFFFFFFFFSKKMNIYYTYIRNGAFNEMRPVKPSVPMTMLLI